MGVLHYVPRLELFLLHEPHEGRIGIRGGIVRLFLRLREEILQSIIASRIAAHAADIAKKIPHARDLDDAMADARRTFDWEKQWECSIDPETAKAIRDSRAPEHEDSCSMCGKFCAVRSMNKALAGEYIDIL